MDADFMDRIQFMKERVEESRQRLLNQSYVKFNADQMKDIYRMLY